MTAVSVAALVSIAAPSAATSASVAHRVVRVNGGFLRGVSHGDVTTFLGIPYAAPPTGDLRWRAPRPAAGWHGVRDASQFGPSCPQATTFNPFLPLGPISEDCLYLNVYTPNSSNRGRHSHPVLVWIHGGGLTEDGARNYDGSKLAAEGIIVVTIDYRLGALGFLANPALATRPGGPSGNYGLIDQQAALRWVQRNIARFGGDRRRVTIAGQSAGGLSVLAHLVSRGSRGLFQRAIVQSGAFALNQRSLADAEASGEQFASAVGCSQNTADCLRQAPVEDLVNNFGVEIPGDVDGSVLTEPIGTALDQGKFAHVPILDGITHDEERLFVDALGIAVSNGTNVLVPERPVTNDNYQSNIAGALGVSQQRAAAIAAGYPLASYPSADVAFSTLMSDANFACPALRIDRLTAGRHSTFAYQFNDDNAPFVLAPPGQFPAVATHDSELPYLFDQPNTPVPATLDADQQALAATMRAAWANFVAYGDPSSIALPWPSFAHAGSVMSLTTPQSTVTSDAESLHRCSFWSAG
jgi:para-nitrobenzyl esterase